jgi:hypothetical protein
MEARDNIKFEVIFERGVSMRLKESAKIVVAFVVLISLLSGCAATQIALEKKDLDVQTQMSDTIFLDADEMASNDKTVFVSIKNTSDKDVDIDAPIRETLTSKGYQIVPSAANASYVLQANILYAGMTNPSALRSALDNGYGGALAGMAGGAVIGAAAKNTWRGAGYGGLIGGLVGGTVEMVSGALVKDVYYTIVTDVLLSARTEEEVSQQSESKLKQGKNAVVTQTSTSATSRKKYQTRILSTANKVNLKFEDALPPIKGGLVRSISGIF